MLELFASLPYKEWYAIGELVDNSIQSWIANRELLRRLHGRDFKLVVDIEVDGDGSGLVVVTDNAAGIATDDWERAMRVAVPPDDTGGLSQFGVGLKAAACWFARTWSVRSSAVGESVERVLEIDVGATVASEIEDIQLVEVPKDPSVHGTVVTMRDLRRRPWGRGIQKIKLHLASIYREFLRDGDVVIRYNGEVIEYEEQPILRAPRWDSNDGVEVTWRKDFALQLRSGRIVCGWLALRESGKQAAAGLALLYRRKVIAGAGDSAYKPVQLFGSGNSFQSQRLFGEIDVSAFDVSHTKDSLLWGDEEDEFLDLLVEVAREPEMPLLAQAQNYRAPRLDVISRSELERVGTYIATSLAVAAADEDVAAGVSSVEVLKAGGSYLDEHGVDHEQSFSLPLGGSEVLVTMRLVREPMERRWIWTFDDPVADQFTIVVNRSHPFMRAYCEAPVQDLEAVWLLSVAIVLGVRQAHEQGARMVTLVLDGINDYVRRLAHAYSS